MALFTLLLSLLLLQISAAEDVQSDTLENSNRPAKNSIRPAYIQPAQNSIRPAKNDVLAFSADLSEDYVAGPGGTIVFDRTITNVGGWYFNGTGQFLCPDGLWMFTWNLAKAGVSGFDGMRGIGALRTGAIDRKYGPKSSYYNTESRSGVSEMTAIVECTTSPPTAVTIAAKPWTEDITSTSVFAGDLTTFSGFKLQAGIAFTAELSQDQYAFPGGRVRFDNDIVNVGGYYNVMHGYFRCPDAAVYVFSVSTHTPDPATPWSVSRLMMEGALVMEGPITYIATSSYDSGSSSITAVLQCTPDFSIYVDSQAAHDFRDNSYGERLTSFTGFKLYDITTETVAFFAVLTQNFTASKSNDPIPFDKLITNIGGAFNISNSRFVCPDDEYYMFTWTATMTIGFYIHLHMDGARVKQGYATAQTSLDSTGTSGSCSQSVILQCQAASMLQVVHETTNPAYILLGGYTSFSGYKLPG